MRSHKGNVISFKSYQVAGSSHFASLIVVGFRLLYSSGKLRELIFDGIRGR